MNAPDKAVFTKLVKIAHAAAKVRVQSTALGWGGTEHKEAQWELNKALDALDA